MAPAWMERLWDIDDNWLESAAVVLLTIASVAAAWGGYQSARWGGVQSTLYSQAAATRVESTRATTTGYLYALNDIEMFNSWAEAYVEGNTQLQAFYERRFSPELAVAVTAWVATQPLQNPDAPVSPLRMDDYATPQLTLAQQLGDEAAVTFEEGQQANQNSDEYVLTTVFLAIVLFFAGISSRLLWRPAKVPIVLVATAMLVVGLVRLATLPIT